MPHTDTIKSQATNHTSYHASHRYQQIPGNKTYFLLCFRQVPTNHRQQIINLAMPHTDIEKSKGQIAHLTMPHTDTSKSQATNRKSYTQIPANHRHQILHLTMPHRYQQTTGDESYILPCLTQIPATHRQQIVNLAMPQTHTSTSQATNRSSYHASHRYQQITGNKSYILPCLTQKPAHHRQQIVHLTMPHTDTRKSQATNRTSCHASHRYHQITGNKSYI